MQSGCCSATSTAQEAAPYPQSRTFLTVWMGGKISRPSNTMSSTRCCDMRRSASSCFYVSERPISVHHRSSPHLIHGHKVYRLFNRILLEISTMDRHCAQILTAHARCACQRVTECISRLAYRNVVWNSVKEYSIFSLSLCVFVEPCRQVKLTNDLWQSQVELKSNLI